MKEGLKSRVLRFVARKRLRGTLARVNKRYDNIVSDVEKIITPVLFVASLACLTTILIYVGFDSTAIDRKMLVRIMRVLQGCFVFGVMFNIIFDARRTLRDSRFVKRVADVGIVLSVVPMIVRHIYPEYSWIDNRYVFFGIMSLFSIAEISYGTMQLLSKRTNPSMILSISFLIFIFVGAVVLMLPRCTVAGHMRFVDALFMAASAVSMTGLSTVDTAATFTPIGWVVIAILMQIGALGVLTFTSFFALFFSGRASIYNQLLMRDFVYSKSMSSLMPMILYILAFTVVIEIAGSVAIYFTLPEDFCGSVEGRVAFSAFHSLSAFCNCGFTTLSQGLASPVLMKGNQMFYVVLTCLIFAGGIGFPNLVNFKDVIVEYFHRFKNKILGRPRKREVHIYDLNTRLVLLFSVIFFVGGFVGFYLLEYNHSFEGMTVKEKLVQAAFCSATVRTAGFTTVPPTMWLGATFLMAMFMMWVGCSSQSMGGGIKINTFAAVILNLRSIIFGQKGVAVFGRTIAPTSIRRANAVLCLSIFSILFFSSAIMIIQPELPMKAVMFEAFSAITTIGMSLGITPELSDLSKVLIAAAMFLGRVGIISVLCGIVGVKPDHSALLPSDDIIIN